MCKHMTWQKYTLAQFSFIFCFLVFKWRRSAFAEHRIKQRQRNIINTLQTQHQKSLKIQQWNESYETKGQADLQART